MDFSYDDEVFFGEVTKKELEIISEGGFDQHDKTIISDSSAIDCSNEHLNIDLSNDDFNKICEEKITRRESTAQLMESVKNLHPEQDLCLQTEAIADCVKETSIENHNLTDSLSTIKMCSGVSEELVSSYTVTENFDALNPRCDSDVSEDGAKEASLKQFQNYCEDAKDRDCEIKKEKNSPNISPNMSPKSNQGSLKEVELEAKLLLHSTADASERKSNDIAKPEGNGFSNMGLNERSDSYETLLHCEHEASDNSEFQNENGVIKPPILERKDHPSGRFAVEENLELLQKHVKGPQGFLSNDHQSCDNLKAQGNAYPEACEENVEEVKLEASATCHAVINVMQKDLIDAEKIESMDCSNVQKCDSEEIVSLSSFHEDEYQSSAEVIVQKDSITEIQCGESKLANPLAKISSVEAVATCCSSDLEQVDVTPLEAIADVTNSDSEQLNELESEIRPFEAEATCCSSDLERVDVVTPLEAIADVTNSDSEQLNELKSEIKPLEAVATCCSSYLEQLNVTPLEATTDATSLDSKELNELEQMVVTPLEAIADVTNSDSKQLNELESGQDNEIESEISSFEAITHCSSNLDQMDVMPLDEATANATNSENKHHNELEIEIRPLEVAITCCSSNLEQIVVSPLEATADATSSDSKQLDELESAQPKELESAQPNELESETAEQKLNNCVMTNERNKESVNEIPNENGISNTCFNEDNIVCDLSLAQCNVGMEQHSITNCAIENSPILLKQEESKANDFCIFRSDSLDKNEELEPSQTEFESKELNILDNASLEEFGERQASERPGQISDDTVHEIQSQLDSVSLNPNKLAMDSIENTDGCNNKASDNVTSVSSSGAEFNANILSDLNQHEYEVSKISQVVESQTGCIDQSMENDALSEDSIEENMNIFNDHSEKNVLENIHKNIDFNLNGIKTPERQSSIDVSNYFINSVVQASTKDQTCAVKMPDQKLDTVQMEVNKVNSPKQMDLDMNKVSPEKGNFSLCPTKVVQRVSTSKKRFSKPILLDDENDQTNQNNDTNKRVKKRLFESVKMCETSIGILSNSFLASNDLDGDLCLEGSDLEDVPSNTKIGFEEENHAYENSLKTEKSPSGKKCNTPTKFPVSKHMLYVGKTTGSSAKSPQVANSKKQWLSKSVEVKRAVSKLPVTTSANSKIPKVHHGISQSCSKIKPTLLGCSNKPSQEFKQKVATKENSPLKARRDPGNFLKPKATALSSMLPKKIRTPAKYSNIRSPVGMYIQDYAVSPLMETVRPKSKINSLMNPPKGTAGKQVLTSASSKQYLSLLPVKYCIKTSSQNSNGPKCNEPGSPKNVLKVQNAPFTITRHIGPRRVIADSSYLKNEESILETSQIPDVKYSDFDATVVEDVMLMRSATLQNVKIKH